METLSIFIHEKEFYHFISNDLQKIAVHIGLNMLKTTKAEYDLITKDPENFVNLALDTCDKQ